MTTPAATEKMFDLSAQTLQISKLDETSFTANGRRDFLAYRDTGIADATKGGVGAVVTRITADAGEATTGWHYHVCDLQLFYILRGYFEIEFEGTGVIRLEAGTCANIPPGLAHNERKMSPDMEVLEVTIPPKIGTVPVPPPAGA